LFVFIKTYLIGRFIQVNNDIYYFIFNIEKNTFTTLHLFSMNRLVKILLLFFVLLLSQHTIAQNRYWVAGAAATWSGNNWSSTSGGAADGIGPPTAVQNARFDANGLGNCTINVVNPSITDLTISGYTSSIVLNGNVFNVTGTSSLVSGTISGTAGVDSLKINSSSNTTFGGTVMGAVAHVQSSNIYLNGSIFNSRSTFIKNGAGGVTNTGGNTFNGVTILTHSGAGGNWVFANTTADDFNGKVTITNSGSGSIYMAHNSVGNTFDGNVILNSTGGNIFFGNNGGTSTLAATFSISIGGLGYNNALLRLRNFTQTGATAQSMTLTGTSNLDFNNANWGGNVLFITPSIQLLNSTFSGTSTFTKNGTSNDLTTGGNTFVGNAIFNCTGAGYFGFGNSFPDVYNANVTLNNSGSSNMYLAHGSIGNTVAGNLTINNIATGTTEIIYVASQVATSLSVTGDVVLNNTGTGDNCQINFADDGDVTIGGNLTVLNASTGNTGQVQLSVNVNSSLEVSGNTLITNNGSGTTKRIYIGNDGDLDFTGTLTVNNNSTATNSQVYINHASNSTIVYQDNIIVTSTQLTNDGVFFGNAGGSGVLATTKTITIGGGGFIGEQLFFRNFTQTGATAHTLNPSNTNTNFEIIDCQWGGNINFQAARISTRGTTYSGTAILTKKGAGDDRSVGGNTFVGNVIFNNDAVNYFMMGNGSPDILNANLTINNTGSSNVYFAYNSAGNSIGGSLTVNNTNTGTSSILISDVVGSTLTIGGATTINNNGTGDNSRVYFGDQGTITQNGDVIINNTAIGTGSIVSIANNTNSVAVINGNVTVNNTSLSTNSDIYIGNNGLVTLNGNLTVTQATAATNSNLYIANSSASAVSISGNTLYNLSGSGITTRGYIGNNGNVTFTGTVEVNNSSTANNSEVYFNLGSTSSNIYNDNIIITATDLTTDGFYFGTSGGMGTLANTKTVSIGGAGFIGNNLYFRNFTQVGATPQTLLTTGSACTFNIYDCNWGGNVNFQAANVYTRGTVYSGTVTLSKTGSLNDASVGGNTFTGNTILNNSGTGYFLMGNGSPDVFSGNVVLNNTGTNSMYLAHNSAGNTIAGNLVANNTGNGNNVIYLSNSNGSDLIINGKTRLINSGTGTSSTVYLGNNGAVVLNDSLIVINSVTATNGDIYLASTSNSSLIVNGATTIFNGEAGNSKRIYCGNSGDVTFNGKLSVLNESSANNSQIYFNHTSDSENQYNDDIIVESTHADCDGIFFGAASGIGTLAATKTITIGAGGFIAGSLVFDNFTQVGPTAQTLTTTGTSNLDIDGSSWGGNIDFTAPGMSTQNSSYAGTADFEKTGASSEVSNGGNTFASDATITNSGSGYWRFGNSTLDVFSGNVTLSNTGTSLLYFAYNGLGHSVAGNLDITNSPTDVGHVYVNTGGTSSLTVGGNVTILNNPTGPNCDILFAENGQITVAGNLTATNSPIGDVGEIFLANGTGSSLSIGGTTTLVNSGTTVTNRIYAGSSGDVTFTGDLSISNTSSATNSQVHLNYQSNSSNIYNGNITIESTHLDGDGILFGNNGGEGTLAATKTITISGGGFIGGDLYFRNFTQVGATPQSLIATGVANFTNYGSNWGGDVIFTAPRMSTRETNYSGTTTLTKTGATDDQSAGGNTFVGNTILNVTGTDYILMGNGNPDTFGGDLTMNNSSTDNMYLAYNSAGNSIAGNLVVNCTGNGNNYNYLSTTSTSTLSVGGNITLNNSGTGNVSNIYLGSSGSVSLTGNLTILNNPTGNNGYIYMADGGTSVITIGGTTTVTNSGTAPNTRAYLGDNGDVTFGNDLTIINSSNATNSQVYLNQNGGSNNVYNGNIVVSATHANNDGVYFGNNGGTGVLAATKTITIGGGGFIAGDLFFRNFTQTGATAQTLNLTGTANFTNYASNWGGNVIFTAPRMSTRETVYSGTTTLTKNGATDDASTGGNTFVGNTILNNSGSGYFLMGNGLSDQFSANLTMNNTGSRHMYLAHNSAGNTIAGDFTVTNNGTASSYIYLSTNSVSTLTIGGNATINNNGPGADVRSYLGSSGSVVVNGTTNLMNQASGNVGYFYVADNTNSTVTFNGAVTLSNAGAGSVKRVYFGNNGDVVCNGNLAITNSSSSSNSEIYLNNSGNSSNAYNGNVTVASTNASSDGVYFGSAAGVGVLAATRTITIGAGGFSAGDLYFRNFTQTGATAQSLTLTGTTNTTLYASSWGGNLTISSPRITTRETVYNGATTITKTANGNDDSYGSNVFNQSVTFNHNGIDRMRLSNNFPDDFNGNVTYTTSSTGTLEPSYNGVSTYAQNITFNTINPITLGVSTGVVEMNGTTAQSINRVGASAIPVFRRFALNNAVEEVTLNTPITGSVQLQFNQGNLISTPTNFMTLLDNVTTTGASNNSYVYGPIEKIGNDAFTFPVGDSGFYRPIIISAPSSTSSAFKAAYAEVNPETAGYSRSSKGVGIEHVSLSEYWLLERTVGTNNVFVTLTWGANSGGVDNLSELRVGHFSGGVWANEGNGGTSGGFATGSIVSGAAITSFSPFTLASTTVNNPLPIVLNSFDVTLFNSDVSIVWETQSEINNDYFTVEKSTDGIHYEFLTRVDGAGNSVESIQYSTIDPNPYRGVSYYRLRQTDFNGKVEVFEPKSVQYGVSNSITQSKVYPNPVNQGEAINIEFLSATAAPLELYLYNVNGALLSFEKMNVETGETNISYSIPSNLAKGRYTLELIQNGIRIDTQTILIK